MLPPARRVASSILFYKRGTIRVANGHHSHIPAPSGNRELATTPSNCLAHFRSHFGSEAPQQPRPTHSRPRQARPESGFGFAPAWVRQVRIPSPDSAGALARERSTLVKFSQRPSGKIREPAGPTRGLAACFLPPGASLPRFSLIKGNYSG